MFNSETICYDDGCHLKRYACNAARSALTTTASRLASLNYAIDRMHFKGHIDPWCHNHCDPNKFKELENVRAYHCKSSINQKNLVSSVFSIACLYSFAYSQAKAHACPCMYVCIYQ